MTGRAGGHDNGRVMASFDSLPETQRYLLWTLVQIARADGDLSPLEATYVEHVAELLALDEPSRETIRAALLGRAPLAEVAPPASHADRVQVYRDAVVLAVGNTFRDEGEWVGKDGGDRTRLTLRPVDEALVWRVARVNACTAVVLYGGSAFVTEAWRTDVGAILMAWYPGMEGGRALADVLVGDGCPAPGRRTSGTSRASSGSPAASCTGPCTATGSSRPMAPTRRSRSASASPTRRSSGASPRSPAARPG